MQQKRSYYLDILRVICIGFVIFNHTRTEGFELYTVSDLQSVDYYVSLFLAILCKVAVPIFFMISGVTLLSKEEDLKTFFKKRVLRFALIILIFTFLQYLRIYRVHPENGFSLKTWLLYVYSGNVIEPYWFLKSYFSFLLIVPILRILVKNMEKKHFIYLLVIKGVESVATFIMIYSGYSMNITFPLNVDIIFFPLIGYWFGCPDKEEKPAKNWVFVICCFLVTALLTIWDTLYFRRVGAHFTGKERAYTWIIACLFFLSLRGIRVNGKRAQIIVTTLGGAVFGTYLIEDAIRNQFEFLYPVLIPYIGRISTSIVFVLASALTGLAIISVIRLIPFVRKLI